MNKKILILLLGLVLISGCGKGTYHITNHIEVDGKKLCEDLLINYTGNNETIPIKFCRGNSCSDKGIINCSVIPNETKVLDNVEPYVYNLEIE